MTLAITNAERYRVLAGYHHDIFSAIEQRQLQRAMRLLFAFAEDYCINFESDVAALSDKYQQAINAPTNQNPDSLSFLQAFHRLWIAMEDDVLAGFPPEVVQGASPEITIDDPHTAAKSSALVNLKKTILFRSSQASRPLVELKQAVRNFAHSQQAFKLGPINLTIPQGQIVGVVGPNGSGKTTLLRLLAADLMQSTGEIDFSGLIAKNSTDPAGASGFWPRVRSKIAYVPPSPEAIYYKAELALWITGAAHGIPTTELEHQINVVMHKYGLSQYSEKRVSELSTGYRLRFELARILFTNPSLLVLDEPFANLDRNAQLTVLEDLKMLSASVETPRSIVISSQHIEEISSISDYLMFLSDGTSLFSGRREEVANILTHAMFEISVTDRLDDLERLLTLHGAVEIDRTAVSMLALFPKGTDSALLVQAIYQAGLRITNFRDLSNSIEMLLLMARFKSQHKMIGLLHGQPNDRT
jgi:ABC-2 type transport system ATP-binding protein